MSTYTIDIDWDGKDALADSSSAKIISGDDFQTEFEAVRTAVNSKADLVDATQDVTVNDLVVSGTLAVTGIPTIPTAATSTNTTQAASTAMVQAAIDADVTTHAALRSSSTVYGHAKIYTSGGDLYIVTT
tara:strand:+ start:275 stop:664 length:390 start_codon:yes stop_codon:yes gene_type:complete